MRAPIARGANESLINKIFINIEIKSKILVTTLQKPKLKQNSTPPPLQKKERKQNGKEMKIEQ